MVRTNSVIIGNTQWYVEQALTPEEAASMGIPAGLTCRWVSEAGESITSPGAFTEKVREGIERGEISYDAITDYRAVESHHEKLVSAQKEMIMSAIKERQAELMKRSDDVGRVQHAENLEALLREMETNLSFSNKR